jgi:hypothetical protein
MSGNRNSIDRGVCGRLTPALASCGRDRVTGVLQVVGIPGGVFQLRQGAVVAVDSPGAPGVGTLLLRSGRISETEWIAALQAGTAPQAPGTELVTRGHLGAAELQVISMMAARDAAFAIIAGRLDDCYVNSGPSVIPPPALQGVEPQKLLSEAVRRLDALGSLPMPVSPDRERVVPAPGVGIDRIRGPLAACRREILVLANGRRNARDIAFMIGRGVYTVTVEISRMLGEGLLDIAAWGQAAAITPSRSPAPRRADPLAASSARAAAADGAADLLPRRSPGASGINEKFAAVRTAASWKGLLRSCNRIRKSDPDPSDS